MTYKMFPRLDLMDVFRRLCEQRVYAKHENDHRLAEYCEQAADLTKRELISLGVRQDTIERVRRKAEEKIETKINSCLTSKV